MAKEGKKNAVRELGMIAHTELASTNPEATKRFLEKVFRWNFETIKTPAGDLLSFHTSGGARGSVRQTRPNETPFSMNYILVDNLDSAGNEIERMGGEIILPRVDVPDMGSFFWFKVPGGPVLACWEDAPERRDSREG